MGTPALTFVDSATSHMLPASLRTWLHGNWALLFSHPDDFACYGFEADRWLIQVRDAFLTAGMLPVALTTGASLAAGRWILDVGGSIVTAVGNIFVGGVVALGPATRFVSALDSDLHVRRTFLYTAQESLPSPIDLVAIASSLRADDGPARRLGVRRWPPALA